MMYRIALILLLTVTHPYIGYCQKNNEHLTGVVIDSRSGKVLPDANIELICSRFGTISDKRGKFIFSKTVCRNDTLRISYIGYKTASIPIDFTKNLSQPFYIKLKPETLVMPGVHVTANRMNIQPHHLALEPTAIRLNSEEIRKIPFAVIPDIYRVLQKIPAVTFTNEASNQINVRGGNFDQNLVMLDGAVVYYPFHFLGLASSFNLEMIEDINLVPGGFSAAYGNRLSSVLNVNTKRPQNNFPNRFNINLLGTDITVGGKIRNKLGWLFSGRTGYLDLVCKFIDEEAPYQFYDGLLKIEYLPHKNHLINFVLFNNKDRVGFDEKVDNFLESSSDSSFLKYKRIHEDQFSWSNRIVSLEWMVFISDKLNFQFQIYKSGVQNRFRVNESADFPKNIDNKYIHDKNKVINEINKTNSEFGILANNRFSDWTTKISTVFIPLKSIRIHVGSEFSEFNTNYRWEGIYYFSEIIRLFFDNASEPSFYHHKNFRYAACYGEAEFNIKDRLNFRQGFRFSKWSFLNKIFVEPRCNIKYNLTKRWTARFAYGYFTQGISTALEEGLIRFLELYFPVDTGNDVESARHFIANMAYQSPSGVNLSLSAYLKTFNGLIKSVGPEPTFTQTSGRASGIEIEFKGKLFGFDSNISYVWSHSNREFGNIKYDTNFDQRHRVQVFLSRQISKNWVVSSIWQFHTGQPYNPGRYLALIPNYFGDTSLYQNPLNIIDYYTYEVDVPRGRIRYPYYHRLDISIMKIIQKKKISFAPYLNIRNAYNRRNVLFYTELNVDYAYADGKSEVTHLKRKAFSLPIIPTFGLRIGF